MTLAFLGLVGKGEESKEKEAEGVAEALMPRATLKHQHRLTRCRPVFVLGEEARIPRWGYRSGVRVQRIGFQEEDIKEDSEADFLLTVAQAGPSGLPALSKWWPLHPTCCIGRGLGYPAPGLGWVILNRSAPHSEPQCPPL